MNILDLLDKRGIEYKLNIADNASITCPNAANHEGGFDANPSFNISLSGRGSNCLACGFKLSPTGTLKWLLGEELDEGQMRCLELRGKLKRIQEATLDPIIVPTSEDIILPPLVPWEQDYRGIKAETYKWLGIQKCERGRYANRLVAQIWMNGVLRGVDARALGDEKPKYLRNAGAKAKEWLSFYDTIKAMKPKVLLLVEGLFNSISGMDRGQATSAYFGVNNWSQYKLLKLMELGVEEVCIWPDMDKAGLEAVGRIGKELKPWFKVTIPDLSKMEHGQDLEVLSQEVFEYSYKNRKEMK